MLTAIREACALPQRDDRQIYEWCAEHITEFPGAYSLRGGFDARNSPWIKRPLEGMRNPRVRRTTASKAVQMFGSGMAEMALVWRLVNDPGPCTYTCQSDDMASKAAKTRIWPLMECIEPIRRILPRHGPLRSQQEIIWRDGSFLMVNSANISHQQSQSVRYKINDEIWMPRWADVYEDACMRVSAFARQGTSHILDISQGGFAGDIAEKSFLSGSQEEWGAYCQGCIKWYPLWIHQTMRDDPNVRAGIVWELDANRQDGTYDETRAASTARFRCPHCGHEHADTDRTRQLWRATGEYRTALEKPPIDWESFHWESLPAHTMAELAVEYCRAENAFHRTGDESGRIKFRQKREARSWVVRREVIEIAGLQELSGYGQDTFRDGATIPGEIARHMTIDKQQGHWWVEIWAWGTEEDRTVARQLYFGRVETRDMLRHIQLAYGVVDGCTGQDRAYMPEEVDRDSIGFGWFGMQGAKVRGARWKKRDRDENLVAFPYSDPIMSPVGDGQLAPYIEFDGEFFKDVLANSLAGRGIRILTPDDANPLWREHVAAEEKREVKPGKWHWEKIPGKKNNHGLDTAVQQLCIAAIRRIIRVDESL